MDAGPKTYLLRGVTPAPLRASYPTRVVLDGKGGVGMSLGDWVMAGVAIVVAAVVLFVVERTRWKQR